MEWLLFIGVAIAIIAMASRSQWSIEGTSAPTPALPTMGELSKELMDALSSLTPRSLDEIESLLRRGADVNANGGYYRPLHRALSRSDAPAVVALLLRYRANPNARNDNGDTPLHYLSDKNLADAPRAVSASHLIAHGADVNALNSRGATPLHLAAARGESEVIEVLLRAGANVGAMAPLTSIHLPAGKDAGKALTGDLQRTTKNATPLHFAAINASSGAAARLLAAGADANARTADGVTPLQIIQARRARYAAQSRRAERGMIFFPDSGHERIERANDDFEALLVLHTRP